MASRAGLTGVAASTHFLARALAHLERPAQRADRAIRRLSAQRELALQLRMRSAHSACGDLQHHRGHDLLEHTLESSIESDVIVALERFRHDAVHTHVHLEEHRHIAALPRHLVHEVLPLRDGLQQQEALHPAVVLGEHHSAGDTVGSELGRHLVHLVRITAQPASHQRESLDHYVDLFVQLLSARHINGLRLLGPLEADARDLDVRAGQRRVRTLVLHGDVLEVSANEDLALLHEVHLGRQAALNRLIAADVEGSLLHVHQEVFDDLGLGLDPHRPRRAEADHRRATRNIARGRLQAVEQHGKPADGVEYHLLSSVVADDDADRSRRSPRAAQHILHCDHQRPERRLFDLAGAAVHKAAASHRG
mmetsp:Transcript_27802/g.63931  ORF Transcript_27802/g.63931 Transcript_27802/m.63931 type:complete len:365 (+) Transcript_27802:361-1455(+)